MYFTLQRYKFSSKSQLVNAAKNYCSWCILPCKGTNFQANHNMHRVAVILGYDVFYLAKVQIFKQITTPCWYSYLSSSMCFTLQRYKFSSKSQRLSVANIFPVRCVLPCKGTNFQANHNDSLDTAITSIDVFYLAKVQIFKQITTWILYSLFWIWCVLPCKGTNFQANHN